MSKLSLVAIFSVVTIGAGCAGNGAGNGGASIGQEDSQNAGNALGAGIEEAAAGFGPVNGGAAADSTCITLSGDTSDPDGDSIPTSAKLTFNCAATRLGFTGTMTGTEMVTDDQPTTVAWAFTASTNRHNSLTGPAGASIVNDRSGQIVASQGSVIGPFTLARILDATTVFKAASGATTTVDETNDWLITYTPGGSWAPGGAVVPGSVTASGTWVVTVGANAANATLATPTPLTLTPSCATRVTAGKVTGTYEGNGHMNTITVTWTGCGQSTVTYTQQ